jgi:hypothetical protein
MSIDRPEGPAMSGSGSKPGEAWWWNLKMGSGPTPAVTLYARFIRVEHDRRRRSGKRHFIVNNSKAQIPNFAVLIYNISSRRISYYTDLPFFDVEQSMIRRIFLNHF